MKVSIISITANNMCAYIANFARVCYNRDNLTTTSENDLQRCKYLWKNEHKTPFESINIDFLIENVSRSLLAQITRYRHMVFSVESQRYVKLGTDTEFIVPEFKNHSSENVFDCHIKQVNDNYNLLISNGEKPEDARSILPNATPTRFRVVMNLREFFHFYAQRSTLHAQAEIRELAGLMLITLYNTVDEWTHNLLAYMEESLKHTLKDLFAIIKKEHDNFGGANHFHEVVTDILKEYEEFI